jgi:hypothetical protein
MTGLLFEVMGVIYMEYCGLNMGIRPINMSKNIYGGIFKQNLVLGYGRAHRHTECSWAKEIPVGESCLLLSVGDAPSLQ